ncbi:hypothetical protein BDV18DRAFT_36714 [Aspergillus unguis]
MSSLSHPSSGRTSDPELDQHDTDDLDLQGERFTRNANVSNTFALMRAAVELRLLETTTAILRIARANPVSISNPGSTIRRAIDRREQRIACIFERMTKDDFDKSVDRIVSRINPIPAPDFPQRDLSPSEMIEEALASVELISREGDERLLCVSSSTATSVSVPKLNTLVSEEAVPVVDENVRSGQDDEERITSSVPACGSESAYSTLGRSLSANNMHSITSIPPQCKVVSAAQYTKIIAEKELPSNTACPLSIDSLVAENARVDRPALEVSEHRRAKSADSFPGEFPVSERLEFSSLATAKHHSRIPSIRTSVRPFSDL